ncbi:peptidoglycan DD-metalloendopeptidase family protein [Gloeobacter violaceus]|nr:M23 family metallopeptidase [Gloeobacter violaceus]
MIPQPKAQTVTAQRWSPARVAQRRRSWGGWAAGALAVAVAAGGAIALRNAAPVEQTADANLVLLLQQHSQSKVIAALAAVESGTLAMLDGRRSVVSHPVSAGDTLASLAAAYKLDARSIAFSNGLDPQSPLTPSQKLLIPPVDGLVYRVQRRDTLVAVSERHRVPITAIAKATGPGFQDFISPGQLLVIPGDAEALAAFSRAAAEPANALASLAVTGRGVSKAPRSPRGYVWPVRGFVISPYGPRGGRRHMGIDIAGPSGSPVATVRRGTVLFAGWMSGGFGNAVDVRHEDGMVSRYAHLSRILVRPDQILEAGQILGATGCTGRCTGPHLHLELHVGGRAVNPLPFLK